jgi:demethylmenaquinone methyltransferase/2-methoxy-6-polyprenyl-1,4-benzoquinol methylase
MVVEAKALDKRRTEIQRMFSDVAPRYDLLNRLLSARRDVAWRRASAEALNVVPDSLVLDLCCGTGDQALAVHRYQARVFAADFSLSMLNFARQKFDTADPPRPYGLAGDTLQLPVVDGRFAGLTVSFGVRNVEDLQAALQEMVRVLAPGGTAAILEFATPTGKLFRQLYLLYFIHLLPRIGSWISPRGSAYQYLTESVLSFPQRQDFLDEMTQAGFTHTAWQDLSGGIVCLYTGTKST